MAVVVAVVTVVTVVAMVAAGRGATPAGASKAQRAITACSHHDLCCSSTSNIAVRGCRPLVHGHAGAAAAGSAAYRGAVR